MPPQRAKGRRRGQDREVLSGIMYRLKTGWRWRDIPKVEGYAAGSTCHYWHNRWVEEGLWDSLWQRILGQLWTAGKLDLSQGSLDGSHVQVKRGATPEIGDIKHRDSPYRSAGYSRSHGGVPR
jgi:transposase